MGTQESLGQILPGDEGRDALHVAIMAVQASDSLYPGQDIQLTHPEEGSKYVTYCTVGRGHGIVDPFLKHRVEKDQWFWMYLYPNTVTGMRHHWEHPQINHASPTNSVPIISSEEVRAAKEWLKEFADEVEMTYDELIEHLTNYLQDSFTHSLGFDTPDRCYTDRQEMWGNYRIVTGYSGHIDTDDVPFRCAC